jgi:uncharacterized membrane protein YeiH
MYYLAQHFGVVVGAVSGALAAGGKRIDLFGVIVLGVVTALGGGTLRDVVLGPDPALGTSAVFWIRDANYLVTATAASVAMFFIARLWTMLHKLLAIADAFVLAAFTILGTSKAVTFGVGAVNAVFLGVITGVAGGIFRDVLVGEIPLVFRQETYFYATAAFVGALVYVVIERWIPGNPAGGVVGAGIILALRLASIQWKLSLPVFEAGNQDDGTRPGDSP